MEKEVNDGRLTKMGENGDDDNQLLQDDNGELKSDICRVEEVGSGGVGADGEGEDAAVIGKVSSQPKRERNRKFKNTDSQQLSLPSSRVNSGKLWNSGHGESAETDLCEGNGPTEMHPSSSPAPVINQIPPAIPPHLPPSLSPFLNSEAPPFNTASLPSFPSIPSHILPPPNISSSLGNVPSTIGKECPAQSSSSSSRKLLSAPVVAAAQPPKLPQSSLSMAATQVQKLDASVSSAPLPYKVMCANSARVSPSGCDATSRKSTCRHVQGGCSNDACGGQAGFNSQASLETDPALEEPYDGAVGPNLDFPDHFRRVPDAASLASSMEQPSSRFPAEVRLRPRLEKRWSDPDRFSPARVVGVASVSNSPNHRKPSAPCNNAGAVAAAGMFSSAAALPSSSSSSPGATITTRVKNQTPLSPANIPASIATGSGSPSRLSPAPDDVVFRRNSNVKSGASNVASNSPTGPAFHSGNEAQNRVSSQGLLSGRESNLNQQQHRRRAPQLNLEDAGAVDGEGDHLPQQQQQQLQQQHYNWQSSKSTVKDRLCFMFNNETMADVHFKVGKGANVQNIPAHKFVLSIGSAVFDAMFNGYMATKQTEIELPDVEPAAFLATMRFLYTDEVTIGPETVMTTLYAAKKYAVPALESHCVDFLKKNMSPDNSFMLLTQARLFDEPQLAALCLETIDKNTQEAVSAEGFCDVDMETLCVVLERDSLGIREAKLFTAVAKWSEAECNRRNIPLIPENKRQVLGRALHLIRFPLMNIEEFASGPAQSGLLIDPEVVSLFLYFTVNPKPNVPFADVPRCCLTGKEQVVNRFCQTESRWGYSGTSDRLRFMVNRKIFIVGFGLYGSIHGATEYAVNMQITHTDSSRIVGQNETSFPCDGTNATFRVMFKEPVEIYPNMNYTAACTLKGPDSYYGTKGQRKVVHESISRERVVFTFSYAAGSNNGTSVEDGQIPEIIFYT